MWHNIVGNLGVVAIVGSYFLLQTGRIRSADLTYSLGNTVGAILVMISLIAEFNASAFILEGFWALISLYGIFRWFKQRPD